MKRPPNALRIVLTIAGLLGLLGSVSSQSASAERKISVEPSDLPADIRKAIDEAFPNGTIVEIEQEIEGEDPGQWDVLMDSDGKEYEVEITPEGVVKEAKEIGASRAKKKKEKVPGNAIIHESKKWTGEFNINECSFSSTGKNRFFILEPGRQLVLESKDEKVVITVLDETKKIGNVETRVVEEREWEDGELKEVSRNFLAYCRETGDVFYFGEEVDKYENGELKSHGGAWRADEKDSKAGIIMPGRTLVGARHYQELAPNAKDRAEIIADAITLKTPAGTFADCIRVEETSPLEPGDICYKTYAPGIGLIQDEGLLLAYYGQAKKEHGSE